MHVQDAVLALRRPQGARRAQRLHGHCEGASVCTRRSQRATALFTAVCAEQDAYVSAGAGFIVVSLGTISFIPGLPVKPAYYKIDVDLSSGSPRVVGLS